MGCPAAMMPLGVGEVATERANRGRSWVCGAAGIVTSTWFSAFLSTAALRSNRVANHSRPSAGLSRCCSPGSAAESDASRRR